MTQVNSESYRLARECVETGTWKIDPVLGVVTGPKGHVLRRVNGQGYVQLKLPGRQRVVFAHRVIWEYVNGPLSPELTVNHLNGVKRDNRIVNLEAVTAGENVRHAIRTGLTPRIVPGARCPSAKLTEDQARAIYRRAWAGGETQARIGADYGVSQEAVGSIKHGYNWRHVTGHREPRTRTKRGRGS